jgi:HSP20 family protein
MVNLKTHRRPTTLTPYQSRSSQREDLPNLMRRFMNDPFANDFFTQPVSWMPAVEVTESDKELMLSAELPGLSEKDVEISFDDDVLTISGEKTEEHKEDREDSRFHVWERSYGSFRRSFSLPSNVDPDKITADFRNGVLSVRLPKSETEKTRGRKIPIMAPK